MARPLIFVGSRQQMRQVALLAELNDIEVMGIIDHHYYGNTDTIGGIPVIGDERWLLDPSNQQAQQWLEECDFFPANWPTGGQQLVNGSDLDLLRLQRIDVLDRSNAQVINLIHPGAFVHSDSKYSDLKLGRGILIDNLCAVSIDSVSIGDYCVISIGSKVAHHTTLGRNVLLAGENYIHNADVGDNVYFGMYSKITQHHHGERITVGNFCTIWSGAEVTKSIPDNKVYTHTDRILKKIKPIPNLGE